MAIIFYSSRDWKQIWNKANRVLEGFARKQANNGCSCALACAPAVVAMSTGRTLRCSTSLTNILCTQLQKAN